MLQHFESIIEYASLAPSDHNTQPWKFQIEGHYIKLLPDFTRRLPVVDADDHGLFISLGCALENLVIAASHYGYNCNVMYDLKGLNPSILVHLFEDPEIKEDPLYNSIPERHVSRAEYNGEALSPEITQKLVHSVHADDPIQLTFVTGPEIKKQITQLTREASKRHFENPAFKKELADWIRFNDETAEEHKDGLRAVSIGTPALMPALGRFFFETFVSANSTAGKTETMVESSPLLVVFSVKESNPEHWVKLGRNFERFALMATRYKVNHSHISMACEIEETRKKMKALLLLEAEPLLVIRVGYAQEELPVSYRRPVEDLIAESFQI
ncbi:MAG: hypothetical protein U0T11_05060 [Chitinophagaceae bacterium]